MHKRKYLQEKAICFLFVCLFVFFFLPDYKPPIVAAGFTRGEQLNNNWINLSLELIIIQKWSSATLSSSSIEMWVCQCFFFAKERRGAHLHRHTHTERHRHTDNITSRRVETTTATTTTTTTGLRERRKNRATALLQMRVRELQENCWELWRKKKPW